MLWSWSWSRSPFYLLTFNVLYEINSILNDTIICMIYTESLVTYNIHVYMCLMLTNISQFLFLCVVFCRSLFVLLSFIFLSSCCLSFFDLWILITPLVSLISCFNRWWAIVGTPKLIKLWLLAANSIDFYKCYGYYTIQAFCIQKMSDVFGGQIWCVLPTGFQEIS